MLFLLADNGWTQHGYARNAEGTIVGITDPSATQFCLVGALMRACDINEVESSLALPVATMKLIQKEIGYHMEYWENLHSSYVLTNFNDRPGRTVREVIAVIKKAAEKAKA
jgi:YD repeat-containing protein